MLDGVMFDGLAERASFGTQPASMVSFAAGCLCEARREPRLGSQNSQRPRTAGVDPHSHPMEKNL